MWLALVRHTVRVLRKHVAKHGVTPDVALASSQSSRDEGLACKPNHDNAPMPSDERGRKRVTKSKMSCFAKPQEAVSLSRSAKTQGQNSRWMTDLLYAVRLGWSRWRSGTAHLFTPPSPHHFLDTDRSWISHVTPLSQYFRSIVISNFDARSNRFTYAVVYLPASFCCRVRIA